MSQYNSTGVHTFNRFLPSLSAKRKRRSHICKFNFFLFFFLLANANRKSTSLPRCCCCCCCCCWHFPGDNVEKSASSPPTGQDISEIDVLDHLKPSKTVYNCLKPSKSIRKSLENNLLFGFGVEFESLVRYLPLSGIVSNKSGEIC